MGEESDRYAALVEYFGQLRQDEDDSVRRVGEIGVSMFTEAREAALAKERTRRIRGES
jgi:hypothetical protein